MGKLKFYILTSRDLCALSRHTSMEYSNIPKDDLVVIINTLDSDYEDAASEYCKKENIEYYVTQSNGTAAHGKNSVLQLFLDSENDYMVLVDGDDYLTPHGVWVYNNIANTDSPPDAIGLFNQISKCVDFGCDFLRSEEFNKDKNRYIYDRTYVIPTRYIRYFAFDYDMFDIHEMKSNLINNGLGESIAEVYAEANDKFYRNANRHFCGDESHHRVTFLSKKAAEFCKYPEGQRVGEDTLYYHLLKHEASLGNIDFRMNDEYPATYIYDQRVPGTVYDEVQCGTNWDWMIQFNETVDQYEDMGLINDYELPLLKVDYPHDYIGNSLGSSGNYEFTVVVGDSDHAHKIEYPANASELSIQQKINSENYSCCGCE